MKKNWKCILCLCFILILAGCRQKSLPLPEIEEGMRGQLGIDKNINESTIDQYLNRTDSVYRDMRMLVDEADYEAIGGDSYLSGYVEGFEVVPYPYLCNVTGLPAEVGSSYSGTTLFTRNEDGNYIANYKESMHILEDLFPKDKYIFLMCGGGGYAGMTKDMLVALGWDGNRIYNTGGYWYYNGSHKIETRYEEDGEAYYNLAKVIYHPIDFSSLTLINEGSKESEDEKTDSILLPLGSADELRALENEKKTFAVYVYLPGCVSCASFSPIVEDFVRTEKITMYAVNLSDIFNDDNSITKRVSYTPSVFIFTDGEVIAYLDPGSDADLPYYQSLEKLTEWFNASIDIEDLKTDNCNSGCTIE